MDFNDIKIARTKAKKMAAYAVALLLIIVIFICIIILLFLLVIPKNSTNTIPLLIVSAFLLIFLIACLIRMGFLIQKSTSMYRSLYKEYFVKKSLAEVFSNLIYNHREGIPSYALKSTQMVDVGDRYNSNDLFAGKYNDVFFSQADVHIQEKRRANNNNYYVTIFKGRFMIFEFPKKFNFRLEVIERGFRAARIPVKDQKTGRVFRKVEVESIEFNKIFKTYAEDGFETFYLLDPALINNILELGEEYKGKLLLGFIDNKLLVGLRDNKDAFEPPSIFKELDEAIESEKIARDIHLITNFIDKLKLDRKLFD